MGRFWRIIVHTFKVQRNFSFFASCLPIESVCEHLPGLLSVEVTRLHSIFADHAATSAMPISISNDILGSILLNFCGFSLYKTTGCGNLTLYDGTYVSRAHLFASVFHFCSLALGLFTFSTGHYPCSVSFHVWIHLNLLELTSVSTGISSCLDDCNGKMKSSTCGLHNYANDKLSTLQRSRSGSVRTIKFSFWDSGFNESCCIRIPNIS